MPEVVGWMAHCLMQEQVEGNASLVLSHLLGYSALYIPWQQLTGTSQWSCSPHGKATPTSLCAWANPLAAALQMLPGDGMHPVL